MKEWRALRAGGFSAKEILSVFKLTEILGRGDKSTAEDWFPRVMQDAEIPAHRRGSVLEAVKARLPAEDAGFWSRLWTRTGE
ncbi:MAG: hypothetical protein IJX22_01925, partial [Opitutales bacterium]|nr:hypothetical protein [Opitutales bacterium]